MCPATETGEGYVAQLVPGRDSVRVHPGFLRHMPDCSTGWVREDRREAELLCGGTEGSRSYASHSLGKSFSWGWGATLPKNTLVLNRRTKPALPDRKACKHPRRAIFSSQLEKVPVALRNPAEERARGSWSCGDPQCT